MDQRYDPVFQRGHSSDRSRPVAVDNGRRSRLASLEEIAPQLVNPPVDKLPERPPLDDRFDDGPRAQAQQRVQPFQPQTSGRVASAPSFAGTPSGQYDRARYDEAQPGQAQLSQAQYDANQYDANQYDHDASPEELSEDVRSAHRSRAAVWERVLWAIGVVLTVGGCIGLWQSYTLMFRGFVGDSGPTDNYLWMQFLGALAPSLIIVGLATIVALLFRRMLQHDRRSRP